MEWLNQNAGAVQAISAAITLILTAVLVGTTFWYTQTTRQALRLAQNQFEREWKPDLRAVNICRPDVATTFLEVGNLSKATALITAVKIGTGRGQQQDIETFPAAVLVQGGEVKTLSVSKMLSDYRKQRGPRPFIAGSGWECICGICLTYDCAGRQIQSEWLNCVVNFIDANVAGASVYPY